MQCKNNIHNIQVLEMFEVCRLTRPDQNGVLFIISRVQEFINEVTVLLLFNDLIHNWRSDTQVWHC